MATVDGQAYEFTVETDSKAQKLQTAALEDLVSWANSMAKGNGTHADRVLNRIGSNSLRPGQKAYRSTAFDGAKALERHGYVAAGRAIRQVIGEPVEPQRGGQKSQEAGLDSESAKLIAPVLKRMAVELQDRIDALQESRGAQASAVGTVLPDSIRDAGIPTANRPNTAAADLREEASAVEATVSPDAGREEVEKTQEADPLKDIQARHDAIKEKGGFGKLTEAERAEAVAGDIRDFQGLSRAPMKLERATAIVSESMKHPAYDRELDRQDRDSAVAMRLLANQLTQREREAEAERAKESRERRERDAALASEALQQARNVNSVDVERSGKELDSGEFVLPRRITQNYTEHEGKFYSKEGARLMFEDKGNKLNTSTIDKATIADMVTYARAKQWDSIQLSGSKEFRQAAWLEAESQGIKTKGYTPTAQDQAALKSLQQERSTNSISPIKDRVKEKVSAVIQAPRHDIQKSQPEMAVSAREQQAKNAAILREKPGYEKHSEKDLAKIAFYRGILMEREKHSPEPVREKALAEFDGKMTSPDNVRELPELEMRGAAERADERTLERSQPRSQAEEQSL